jgi:TRAP-type C4-dicarboxylate transport system permease small subunit
MKPGKIGSTIEAGTHRLSNSVAWVARGVLFLMMLFVAGDVIGRYVFSRPIKGSEEIAEVMMVVVIFLAMGYCTLKSGHVRVELVTSRLSGHTQAIWDTITSLAGTVLVAFIAWQMGVRVFGELVSSAPRASWVLGIPQAPFILVAAIGMLAMCLELLVHLFRSLTRATAR